MDQGGKVHGEWLGGTRHLSWGTVYQVLDCKVRAERGDISYFINFSGHFPPDVVNWSRGWVWWPTPHQPLLLSHTDTAV